MLPPISQADFATLIDEADQAARRLHRKLALPAADLDDLRQDLLIDLICRLPGFDARRGGIGAFANIVLRNQSSRIAIRHHRQRRAQGGSVLSLDAPVAGGTEPLGAALSNTDGLAAWHGQDAMNAAEIEARETMRNAISHLPEPDRRLCASLAHGSVATLAASGIGSRSAIYRRIATLRHTLTAYGLGPCWDDLAIA